MTETQHTQGPWRVFAGFTDLEIVTDRLTAHATESIVQFKGQANAKANARLIAAAPQLLEGAEDLLGMLSSLADDYAICRELVEEAKELRAAITQAKG